MESNRAPPWKSIPTFFRTGTSSSSASPVTSVPSTVTRPRSGESSPMVWRRSTDFPLPLPPRITMVSPSRTSRFTPRSTALAPKLL